MEVINIKTKDGDTTLAIYHENEKDCETDFSKTEDYGKIVDEINEQKMNF